MSKQGEAQEEGIPRSNMAEKEDERVEKVNHWHQTLERPQGFTDMEYILFMKYKTLHSPTIPGGFLVHSLPIPKLLNHSLSIPACSQESWYGPA